ncbi:MAG: O-antigen ligase family protein [Acidobacteriota bacterium]
MKAERIEQILLIHLLATAILAVLAFGTVESWSLVIFEINALVMAVMMGLLQLVDDDFQWRRLRFSLPLWALLLWGLIQLAPFGIAAPAGGPVDAPPESLSLAQLRLPTISKDPQSTREVVARLLALAIYFTVALQVFRRSAARRLAVRVLAVFGLAISFLAIAQRLTWNGRLYWVRQVSAFVSPFGPYGNYNHFAGMVELLFPLPFAWLIFSRGRGGERILYAIAVVIMVTAAVLSMSRAGMLTIGVQLAFFAGAAFLHRRRQGGGPRLTPLLIVVGAVLLSLWIGYQPLLRRFGTIQQGASEYSVVTRLTYWRASWRMFLDHPLTGVGLGAFPTVYPSYGSSSSRYERVEQVHNDYLQLLTDGGLVAGLIGASALIWLLSTWANSLRADLSRRADWLTILPGASIAVLGLLIHSLLDFNLQIPANALLFLLIVALSVSFTSGRE